MNKELQHASERPQTGAQKRSNAPKIGIIMDPDQRVQTVAYVDDIAVMVPKVRKHEIPNIMAEYDRVLNLADQKLGTGPDKDGILNSR